MSRYYPKKNHIKNLVVDEEAENKRYSEYLQREKLKVCPDCGGEVSILDDVCPYCEEPFDKD